jgi:hypothetical protein
MNTKTTFSPVVFWLDLFGHISGKLWAGISGQSHCLIWLGFASLSWTLWNIHTQKTLTRESLLNRLLRVFTNLQSICSFDAHWARRMIRMPSATSWLVWRVMSQLRALPPVRRVALYAFITVLPIVLLLVPSYFDVSLSLCFGCSCGTPFVLNKPTLAHRGVPLNS